MIKVNYPNSLTSTKISLLREANSAYLPEFSRNELVEGKVLKSFSSNKALLVIKGRKVLAETFTPLKEGKILSLKVEEISPIPILKPLDIKLSALNRSSISMILSALKENIWKSTWEKILIYDLSEADRALIRELMNDLWVQIFTKPSPETLKAFIDRSGLRWEAKLRKALMRQDIRMDHLHKLIEGDLKGLLSKFLALGLDRERGVPLEQFIGTINHTQLLNHHALEQDRKIFLPIPLLSPDGFFSMGQLLIAFPQNGKDECEGHKKRKKGFIRIIFLLELSHLGPLRIDLGIRGKEIQGRFLTTRRESQLLIEKHLPLLISSLKAKGFIPRYLDCYLKDPETVEKSPLREIIQEEGHTISLFA